MGTALDPVAPKPAEIRRGRHERAFLPAALEIVETPPSPIGRLGAYTIVVIALVALAWASLGRVDIVAVAKGKIIPTGYTKIIQPFETGVVHAIHVHDGQKVKAGDLLIELDPTMNAADLGHLRGDLMAAEIDIARQKAALARLSNSAARFVAPAGAPTDQAEIGRLLFRSQIAQFDSKLASLQDEEIEKRAVQESLRASIAKIAALLPMMQERTQMRKTLFDHQNGSKIFYLESLQELTSNQKELDVQNSHLKEADAALVVASARREEMQADYRRAILTELAEAERKARGLEQDVAKAEQRTKYQALTAPIDGTVQQLTVHTIGGVVTPAEALLSIVPTDSRLEIEAFVDNEDIGFVHPGQAVAIKVDTFNFTRYGLRRGTVLDVSQDAVSRADRSGNRAEGNLGEGDTRDAQPGYAARISLDSTKMKVDDRVVSLAPGMGATIEIKTGTRRIIGYLLSPFEKHAQESFRER